VQYYDLREDPEGTLRNWARFGMDVAPLANPGMPETEDDKILVASMEKDVEDNLINGDTYTRTRFVTDAALNVATFFDGVGEASVAGKLGEVSEAASDTGKVAGISTSAEELSKISSEANVTGNSIEGVSAVGKDISDVIDSGIGKDTSKWESADEPIVQANASGDTIPRFSENKFELGNKVVDNVNKPMAASDIAVKSSEAVTPKIDEVLVGSLAVNEASIERAANIIDKTSEAEEVRRVVGAGDETEIETSVNLFKKSGGGAEVGGKSVDEAEIGSGKVNGGKVDEGVSNADNFKIVNETSAEETNNWWKDVMNYDNPPYKPGTTVNEIELTEKTTYVRVYDGDTSGMYGGWVMKAEDIKGLTPEQIQDKFALPSTPKYVCDVNLDAGTHLRTGVVNPLEGWGNGGGIQFDLMGQRTGEFVNSRPLP
jgi:hypothetical protein